MTWAVDQKCGSAAAKLVLLMLANYCNGHTGQCNPSHKRLAAECDMSVDTLKTHLKKLESLGLIDIVPQYLDTVQLPNQYRVKVGGGGGKNSGEGGGQISTEGGGKNSPSNNQEVEPGNKPIDFSGEEFEKAWNAFPKRPGASKVEALKAWTAQVEAGALPADMAAGAQRYAAHCAAAKTESKFFFKPAKFFGPEQHYTADWSADQGGAGTTAVDPDSQPAVEAEGIAKGIGKWDGMCQWSVYKARVRGSTSGPTFNLNQLADMAAQRNGTH